jgi:2-dehydro-3-deoxygluconokinase
MKKIFCFGELLLRMSPELDRRWIEDAHISVYIGGAELNVAAALARWNMPVKYSTALPGNYFSKEIIDALRLKNIDTSGIHFSGKRIGIYYLPQGADLKNAAVIYDRDYSSFSELKPGTLNWDELLEDCGWFHFSAISPAINETVAAVCKEGLEAASSKGLTISVDLNYRAKLWQYGKSPADIMPELVQYCDVVMGNIWAAESLLGIKSNISESKGQSGEMLIVEAENSMKKIRLSYPKVKTTAYTFRLEETYFAVLQHNEEVNVSNEYPLIDIVDKAGSGDCFMGGLIYGVYNQQQPRKIIDFAAAAAVGKMREKGDATNQTVAEVHKIVIKHE